MRTVNHYPRRMLALLLACVLCINICFSTGLLQKAAAEEIAASGVDLMDSASLNGKAGVLSYDTTKKEGWIGGDGTTASTDAISRYFSYNTYGGVVVGGETVAVSSREVTYSVTFSDFKYDTATYPSGVRQQGVILMLQYHDGVKNWTLENRFGGQMYASGHYMQIGGSNSTLLDANAGTPFYSERKNSVAYFPALANGDTISLKVKCANGSENGYIKLLLNGEEKHSFVFTGTKLPEFGLKSFRLMAKISNISLKVDGATGWSACTGHVESEKIVDVQPTAQQAGKWHTQCTICGETINTGTIPALAGMELINADASLVNQKAGVLTYDVIGKEGWIGGDGTTASTTMLERYFQYVANKDVLVDGKAVPLTDCEVTYSVTFSDFTYDTVTYPSGVRQQAVTLMLQYNDGVKTWKIENRFGGQKYNSGHYMQIGGTGSTLLADNAGAPFYSESVKNSISSFPALADGDTVSLKVKCANGAEKGYIKLLLNGEEKHTFIYTGTSLPQFGLKAQKLMAKISNVSVYVAGASEWAANTCSCDEPVWEKVITAPTCGKPGYTTYTCTLCGASHTDDEVKPLGHTCKDGICTVCGAKEWDTDGDGVLEILALGNSFSVDALEYVWQIANNLGIEKVVLGNLNIGGCSLQTHAANAAGDLGNYNYRYSDSGHWTSTDGYKISTALESRDWDYVSLQQQSGNSGLIETYDESLTSLLKYIKERSYAKLIWHMTWAYQQNSTNDSFSKYGKDQMKMYNAIVSTVKSKIVPNSDFDLIVPNGTAVQNSRTSILGDTTTRDGYHMSTGYGRYLTGLMFFKQVTGMSIDGITYAPAGVSGLEKSFAIESVNNAYAKPFEITQSAVQHKAGTAVKENETAATCATSSCYDLVVYCTKCGVEMSRETVVTGPALGHKFIDHVCTVCGKNEGVDLITSATFDNKPGILFYDINRGQGWIGGDGTTLSTEYIARYFTCTSTGQVIVDGKPVDLLSREITYSVTFSDFKYDATTYPNGVRQQGVILMLQYNDGAKTWTLENRFGDMKYQSGHYMQIGGSNSTLLADNAGAPFYSERKNSIANFPALLEGDTVSLKVKCANGSENGYIKLLLNGKEMHSFVYTGTKLPEFGLKSFRLMAKMTNISVTVDGAFSWSECKNHEEGDRIVDVKPSAGVEGKWHTECTVCGKTINTGTIPALDGMELINSNASLLAQDKSVLSYNIANKEGWIGGNGATSSMTTVDSYFTFPIYKNVLVDGKPVNFTDCELIYSMVFSDFNYEVGKNCRNSAVCLMLRYTDGDNVYKLENRFGGQIYDSGHYMQTYVNGIGVGNALQDTGAPFYSTVKNSFKDVPDLKNGDKVELKIKCANGTENGYIKLCLNGAEIGEFVYTGTSFPEFGLESMKLMAKVSNVSLMVNGATQWAECDCAESNVKKYETVTAPSCTTDGLKSGKCVTCGNLHSVAIPASHTEGEDWIVDKQADCTQSGSRHKECMICFEYTQEETIPAAGHRSYWVEDKAATKLIPGSKHEECMVCQAVLNTETIPSEWNPVLVIGGGVILLAALAVGAFFLVKSRRKK